MLKKTINLNKYSKKITPSQKHLRNRNIHQRCHSSHANKIKPMTSVNPQIEPIYRRT